MSYRKIETLLNKYKHDFPRCDSCGGRVIRDREYVCVDCGLVYEKILEWKKRSVDRDTRESDIHKTLRDSNLSKKLHRLDRERDKFTTVEIPRQIHELLKVYLKDKPIYQYQFLGEIILEAISSE